MIKVKNTIGSSRYSAPAGYGSWLDYWEAKTGRRATRCSATDCHAYGRYQLVGAHVKKVYGGDNHSYIVPLCRACNGRTDEFYVDETLVHYQVTVKNPTTMAKSSNSSKVTSKRAASADSKVLRDGRYSATSKTAAGSALSQTPNKRK